MMIQVTRTQASPVILVDDEKDVLESESALLASEGYREIISFSDSRGVLELMSTRNAEAVLLDLTLPGRSGEELLADLRQFFPQVPIVVITASGDVETAVRCMRAGAFDYLVKPVERSRLVSCIRRAVGFRALQREMTQLRHHILSDVLENPEAFKEIRCESRAMLSIFRYMEAIAGTAEPVLIVGETGTGKELIARAMHRLSGRSGELVTVNTASLDDTVLSDALFGHRKGAYTGASESRGGLLAAAERGTLFLDEIGDTSPSTQIKLLRMVETGEYLPLGSDVVRRSNACFIFATNRTIEELSNPSHFRQDLFYRLSTHLIRVPPLRERTEDIPVLVDHFLAVACSAFNKARPAIPEGLCAMLSHYRFPGNVRELRSIVFDAVSRLDGPQLSLEPFEAAMRKNVKSEGEEQRGSDSCSARPLPTLERATEELIHDALESSGGNITEAARTLGISRQALSKRLGRRKKGPGSLRAQRT